MPRHPTSPPPGGGSPLPPEAAGFLRATNPWWEGKPARVLPPYRRWAFGALLRKLESGLAPAVLLRGARQVGKTTVQEQVIDHLLGDRRVAPARILRVQFDDMPELSGVASPLRAITRWYEEAILGQTLNQAAHAGETAYLFFDEVQNLPDWAPQLKSLVDHSTVRAVVTGSSALRIEAGRDSLAGRVTSLEMGPLLLREIAGLRFGEELPPHLPANGLEPLLDAGFWRAVGAQDRRRREVRDAAFRVFSERGGYPVTQAAPETPWPEVADQLEETVIRRVLRHDLRLGEKGREHDAALLEEVFRLVCRYAGQAPSRAIYSAELRQVLGAEVGWSEILDHLKLLDSSLLLRLIRPLELRLKKARGGMKLCLLDLGLRASWLQEVVPLDPVALERSPHLSDLAGHLAESVTGAFLAGIPHLDVAHFPERAAEPEVDFILTIGEKRIPLEVKYRRRIDGHRDTLGLRSFLERTHYNAPFGVLVTQSDDVPVDDPRIVPISLSSLLLLH